MKIKWLSLLLLSSALIFSSCAKKGESGDITQTDISSETETEETEESDVQKDDEGFIILPDGYLNKKEDPSDAKQRNKVSFADKVSGVNYYESDARLYVGETRIPLYSVKVNKVHTFTPSDYQRGDVPVGSVSIKGKITFTLQLKAKILGVCNISPLGMNVPYEIDDTYRTIRFSIDTPSQYTFEFKSGLQMHLFVNSLENSAYTPSNSIYFAKGVHDKNNDNRINSSNTIDLSSNQTVYLEEGAIVRAKFNAYRQSNIKILGPGFIDGSTFERSATTGKVTVPIDFNYCTNITFDTFGVLDPAGWCFNIYYCNQVSINNTKVISSRANGDGISIQSSQNVEVGNSFVRSWDDSLVVKNYPEWSDRSKEGTTNHVHFNNTQIYTDLAQSMEIGYECVGEVMNDITFINMTVIKATHLAPISIHNSNNANLTNVKYENITIERADMGQGNGNRCLIDFNTAYSQTWSEVQKVTGLGSVDGVNLKNIKVLKGIKDPIISIKGAMETRSGYPQEEHPIKNVTIDGLEIYNQIVNSSYANYQTNQYAKNIYFTQSGQVSGANYSHLDVSEYGNNFDIIVK